MATKNQIKKLEKTFPVPPCQGCKEWEPVVVLYIPGPSLDTPPFDRIHHPSVCPTCGRQVTKLVREYGSGEYDPEKEPPDVCWHNV